MYYYFCRYYNITKEDLLCTSFFFFVVVVVVVIIIIINVDLHSVVGIVIRYGLDNLVIESQWGARISATVQTGHAAHPASYTSTGSLCRG
jgi:hypothetical protein